MRLLSSVLVAIGTLPACGSAQGSDLFGTNQDAVGNGGSAQGGAASSGGEGSGSASGSGGTTAAPICIDPTTCPVDKNQVGCCTNDFKCGERVGQSPYYDCVTPDHAGRPDSQCPGTFALEGDAPGCCRSNGTCGYTDTVYGTGCFDPAQLGLAPGKPCP